MAAGAQRARMPPEERDKPRDEQRDASTGQQKQNQRATIADHAAADEGLSG